MNKWEKCVGEGWSPIVKVAVDFIKSHGGNILQVKEKFGGLRIYTHGGDYEAIDAAVRDAERKASTTCEHCGAPGVLRHSDNGYLFTACERHSTLS